uniref:Phosphatase tensin-type domain-containing protein n=1 Tax=Sphaeramia orbicularis TaxID=375764 RepID=A0A672YYA9_9TELE
PTACPSAESLQPPSSRNRILGSIMEEPRRIDLTYITERIIVIFCPPECSEETYVHNLREITHMLQSKHGHNYMPQGKTIILITYSAAHAFRRSAGCGFVCQVLDTGWMDLLAPNLDQIFSVCTVMENWLQTHPKHVLVLHCRVKTTQCHESDTLFSSVYDVKVGSGSWWLLTSTSPTCQPGNTESIDEFI